MSKENILLLFFVLSVLRLLPYSVVMDLRNLICAGGFYIDFGILRTCIASISQEWLFIFGDFFQ